MAKVADGIVLLQEKLLLANLSAWPASVFLMI